MTADAYSPTSAPIARGHWRAPVAAGPLHATVTVPGSKSLTNRELILASLADGSEPPHRAAALRRLGAHDRRAALARRRHRARPGRRTRTATTSMVTPVWPLRGDTEVDCGQAGTVMRFVAGARRLRPRRRHAHRARERAAPPDGRDDHGAARRRRRHRRRRPLGAALHRPRARPRARRRGHDRCERVEPVRLGPAARRPALRRRPAPRPRGRAAAEHPAHRHDRRVPRAPRRARRASGRRRVDRAGRAHPRQGRRDRARPVQRRAVPRRRDDRRRIGVGHGMARALDAAGRHAHRDPVADGRQGRPPRRRAHRHRRAPASRASTSTCRPRASSPPRSSRWPPSPTRPTTLYGIGHIRGHETDRIAALVAELRGLGGEADELPDGIRIVPRPLHGGTLARPPRPPHGDDRRAHRPRRAGRRDRRHRHDRQDDAEFPSSGSGCSSDDGDRPAPSQPEADARHRELARRPRRRRRTRVRRGRHPGAAQSQGQPPAHEAAAGAQPTPRSPACSGVDRGRYTVLVDEDRPDERTVLGVRARELRKMPIVTGDRARVVGDRIGRRRHARPHRRHRGAHVAAAPQRRRHRPGRARSSSPTPTRCSSSSRPPIPSRASGSSTATSSRRWMPASVPSSS